MVNICLIQCLMDLEPLAVRGENQETEQDNENEPSKGEDHDNLLQDTIQDAVSEVSTTVVDGQYDHVLSEHPLPEPNEESDLQHSTDKDPTEEPSLMPLISSDQDVDKLHTTAHPTATTDAHSRSSEAESYSEDGKIISLDIVEAEWDHESDDAEGEQYSEDDDDPSKVTSSTQEQAFKDTSQFCKFLFQIRPRFNTSITYYSLKTYPWKFQSKMNRQTHAKKLIMVSINTYSYFTAPLTLKVSDEVNLADTTLAEGEELHTYKKESTVDEQGSAFG